jgi:hypothetical protein
MRRFVPPRRTDCGEKWRYCVDCGVPSDEDEASGRLWPESMMVNDDGAWRCREHYAARAKYRIDGTELNLEENRDSDE